MSEAEELQEKEFALLDHGYVKFIEHWGSDERIIESARMSTAKGFNGWGPQVSTDPCTSCDGTGVTDDRGFALRGQPFFATETCKKCGGDKLDRKPGDEKLLRYLWENNHATPFEMAGITIEVKAPIMVFREWHRHRVPFGYNEMSARYIPLPDENYTPSLARLTKGGQSKTNKQGSGEVVAEADALEWLAALGDVYKHAQDVYDLGLKLGIAKELARLPVPVARYSRMRATANLRGWLGFLRLRMPTAAQWEIRVYAETVHHILSKIFPRTVDLFSEGMVKQGLIEAPKVVKHG